MEQFSRRTMLKTVSSGFGYAALAGLCSQEAEAARKYENPLAQKKPHHTPKAKRVIFLCMRGGPAQADTFDYKPIKGGTASTVNRGRGKKNRGGRGGSIVKFQRAGKSGLQMAASFEHLSKHADDLCLINSMWTDVPNHPQAYLMLHTGEFRFPRPSVGSWVLYGLGTENQNVPGFITINPPTRVGGAQNYSNGFLPAIYQGTSIGNVGARIENANIGNVKSPLPRDAQRKQLDLIQSMNRDRLKSREVDGNLEGLIESLELGFRMQTAVPELMDLSKESKKTRETYGVGKTKRSGRCQNDDFGRQCLLARRFAEAGVRYIEVCHSNWDQHNNHKADITANSVAIDRPIAALLSDLKQRDLLKDTLVIWGGEFGRTPLYPGRKSGSGHNSRGFSMWMAGGGVKGGTVYGKTDENGLQAVENKVHVHALHATMLHLLGIDHEKLTYRYSGRDFRLTDVHGNVVKGIMS